MRIPGSRLTFACLTLLLLSAHPLPAQRPLSILDFGAVPDGKTDATVAVQKALAAIGTNGPYILDFPRGRYDFWPQKASRRKLFISNTSSEQECPDKTKTLGILMDHLHDLTLEGNGSLFVFHGRMTCFALLECQNITLHNISMDFLRPSMSEMTLETVTPKRITARIATDSWYRIQAGKFYWYGEGWQWQQQLHAVAVNPDSTAVYSAWEPFSQSLADSLGPRLVGFQGDFAGHGYQSGQTLTVRNPVRDQVGGFICKSKNIRLLQVTMHYMHGLGIVSQFSEDLYFDGLAFIPPATSDRKIAAFADCLHFSGCKGEILIENSRFCGSHDDPINVHGTHLQVTAIISGRRVRVRFMHPQTYGFEAFFAGDSIGWVHSPNLVKYGGGTLKSAVLLNEREMELELNGNLPAGLQTGDCMENLSWTPSVTIRHCRFERCNTRGVLVSTPKKVLLESNLFFRIGMHAVLIADDAAGWFESGPVEDVLIRNNRFIDCAYNSAPDNFVIAIAPEDHGGLPGNFVHRNIRLENNEFAVYDYPLLAARSTDQLLLSGNRVSASGFRLPAGSPRAAILLTACRGVRVENNTFLLGWQPFIQTSKMEAKEIIQDFHQALPLIRQ